MKSYKEAGVDKEEGYKTISKIKDKVSQTYNECVLNELGSFGAFYHLKNFRDPVLVSGTDGVGTKLKIALDTKKYDTVGIDCFAMCANDILCHGAKPLFYLDYIACGTLDSEVASLIVSGMVKACKETGCSLIGGETAEMPGIYKAGDYDIAGFCVGAVERENIIDGKNIELGDLIFALPSSGFHSNGFSLIRKIFVNVKEAWKGRPLYETLLEPTALYQKEIEFLSSHVKIKGIAHITGGGLPENIPRILPKGLDALVYKSKIRTPEIMIELEKRGNISKEEMYGTFNMGIGMVIVVSRNDESLTSELIQKLRCPGYKIGEIVKGNQNLELVSSLSY